MRNRLTGRAARLLASAYEWHERHGPFSDLRRADRRLLFAAGAAVAAIYVTALLAVDPDFFLSRLEVDMRNYLLKAARFAETGNTDARMAVNLPPFRYASLPGILRAPVFWVSSDFSTRLRLIQMTNVLGVGACLVLTTGVVAARVRPASRAPVIVALAGWTLVSKLWLWEVSFPNSTVPFMLGSLGATLAAWTAVRSTATSQAVVWWVVFLVGAVASFTMKFTAVSLLAYGALLLAGRALAGRRVERFEAGMLLATAIGMAAATWLGWDALRFYVSAGQERLAATSPKDWLLYFSAVALPSTLVPFLPNLLTVSPLQETPLFIWMTTPRDVVLLVAGLVLSLAVAVGAWRLRRAMLAEALLVASLLPVIAPMATSTARYLLPYAPWVWIFALAGMQPVAVRMETRLGRAAPRTLLAIAGSLLLVGGWHWLSHTGSVMSTSLGTVAGLRSHFADVTSTYKTLRVTLAALPRNRSELLLYGSNNGAWSPVVGIASYAPDQQLRARVAQKEMYLIVVCESYKRCGGLDSATRVLFAELDRYGPFRYVPVATHQRPLAAAVAYRVLPAGSGGGT